MRSKSLVGTITAILAVVLIPRTQPAAQETTPQHVRYRLVEVGTFGGRNSVYNVFTRAVKNDGTVVGAANTSTPDPYAPACFDSPDNCFVLHAWRWRKGVLTDLGVLPGGSSSYTNAINAQGWIVGQSENGEIDPLSGNPSFLATLWSNGEIHDLGTLGGSFSFAIAVNAKNFVMGAAETGTIDTSGFAQLIDLGSRAAEWHAFGWNGGEMFDLGNLGGPGAFPLDMNDVAQIVGISPTTSTPGPFGFAPFAPFLWEKGKMRSLGTLGGTLASAAAINNRGQVVGDSDVAGDVATHPYLWTNGEMRDLGTLGGDFATAEWLNDAGDVIGFSFTAGFEALHGFIWRNGVLIDLGTVNGDNGSNAFGLNEKGQVVGQSWYFNGQEVTQSHAFLWENDGPMVDLNTLVTNPSDLYLTEANFITESGLIVARGFLPNGDVHTAILIPDGSAETPTGDLARKIPNRPPQRLQGLCTSVPSGAVQSSGRPWIKQDWCGRSRAIPGLR